MIVKTAPPSVPRTKQLVVPYLFAFVLTVMAVAQLVNFEIFAQSLATYGLVTQEGATMLAIILLIFEIFALPFLLRLWLSPLARVISAAFTLFAPAVWLSLLLSVASSDRGIANIGAFGGFVTVPLDTLSFLGFLLLFVLAVWSFAILHGREALRMRSPEK